MAIKPTTVNELLARAGDNGGPYIRASFHGTECQECVVACVGPHANELYQAAQEIIEKIQEGEEGRDG